MIAALVAAVGFLLLTWRRSVSIGSQQPASLIRPAHRWFLDRVRGRSRQRQREASAIELVAAFSAELHAGLPVTIALERAADSIPIELCPNALGAARLGGDVPRALRKDAHSLGVPVLRALAALWQVAEDSGAGLAVASHRLAASQASAEAVRRELAGQLAGPKATSRVLAGLPVLGLLLGSGLGADPIGWLLGSAWGWLVLLVGCGFEAAGIVWTRQITRSVELLL